MRSRLTSQIHDLVVRFYREIVFDDLLAPVFGEVAEVDWAVHIPKLIDYWCRVLLREPGYDGFILDAHRHVHEVEPFRVELFATRDAWSARVEPGSMVPTSMKTAEGVPAVVRGEVVPDATRSGLTQRSRCVQARHRDRCRRSVRQDERRVVRREPRRRLEEVRTERRRGT